MSLTLQPIGLMIKICNQTGMEFYLRNGGHREMISQSPDTDPQAEKVQIELIRRSSVARRILMVRSLSQTAMYLSQRAIQRANPSLSEREVDLLFVELHYGKALSERLRSYMERKRL